MIVSGNATDLIEYKSSETVGNENDRTVSDLYPGDQVIILSKFPTSAHVLGFASCGNLRNEFLRVLEDGLLRQLPNLSSMRIVAVGGYTGSRSEGREEISQPQHPIFDHPRPNTMAIKTMDGNYAGSDRMPSISDKQKDDRRPTLSPV